MRWRTVTAGVLVLLVAFFAIAAGGLYIFSVTPVRTKSPSVFQVEAGEGFATVARRLEHMGLVSHSAGLVVLAVLRGDQRRIRAGEFPIPEEVTPSQLLDLLVNGRALNYPVTLLEGWTVGEMRRHLYAAEHLEHVSAGWSDAELMAVLGYPGLPAEGQFFPETYHHPRGSTDLELLARAKATLDQLLAEEWAGRAQDLAVATPQEALILASIVQKETGPGEEALISGVFQRRLRIGMRLQADPTVIYGLGGWTRESMRRRDLRNDTAFNTYTRGGLPPTPIALAGRQAIHAVMHPADGDALYFVARKDGRHHFSDDLASHQAAVRRYQLMGDE